MLRAFGDRTVDQEIGHLLGHLKRHLLLRLGGAGAEMRRRHNILHAEQQILARRFISNTSSAAPATWPLPMPPPAPARQQARRARS